MKVEAKLKRTISKKIADQQARTNSYFPSVWNSQCLASGSFKWHIREYESIKKAQQEEQDLRDGHHWFPSSFAGEGANVTLSDPELELAFSSMLAAEINKISSFHDERHNECVEGLKIISSEIPTICTIKSASALQVWHEFIIQYGTKVKTIEMREDTPTHFIITMEGYILALAEKSVEQALLTIFKKLMTIHKMSIYLKAFAQYNVTAIKKLLTKHDEKAEKSVSTEWTDRMRRESFSTYDSFEKIISLTKDLFNSCTPSVDDFACPICLGLLCEPVAIQCGHRFCEYCLIAASTTCAFCPMCRTEQQIHPSNHVPDRNLKVYLKQFFPTEYKASLREHKNAKRKNSNCIIS